MLVHLQVAEGDVVLECEGALGLNNLVNTNVGVLEVFQSRRSHKLSVCSRKLVSI